MKKIIINIMLCVVMYNNAMEHDKKEAIGNNVTERTLELNLFYDEEELKQRAHERAKVFPNKSLEELQSNYVPIVMARSHRSRLNMQSIK